ncbi:MAG: 50S ribosome-binding protein YggL [Gemmatimonadaceae bacterium]
MSAPCPLFGFIVRASLHSGTSAAAADSLLDDFIGMLEANGLIAGGGRDRTWEHVVQREGAQATHADREAVIAWASRWAHLADITVSDLVDFR